MIYHLRIHASTCVCTHGGLDTLPDIIDQHLHRIQMIFLSSKKNSLGRNGMVGGASEKGQRSNYSLWVVTCENRMAMVDLLVSSYSYLNGSSCGLEICDALHLRPLLAVWATEGASQLPGNVKRARGPRFPCVRWVSVDGRLVGWVASEYMRREKLQFMLGKRLCMGCLFCSNPEKRKERV